MKTTNTYFPFYSIKFWKAYLIHMRPYLLFVSGVGGLAGMALAQEQNLTIIKFLMAFIPFFLAYGFGQALTDCFQIDTDTISSPYRPLVKKEVSPLSVGMVSIIGLVLISFSLIYLNSYNIIWGGMSIVGLATYTFFKKNYWFAGPFYNGWIVMLLPVMGYMSVTGINLYDLHAPLLYLLACLSLSSYANFVIIGYLKDISADRDTNYKTFPVVFGWDKTFIVGDVLVISSIVLCYLLIGKNDLFSFSIFLVASIIAISGQLFGHFTKYKQESNSTFPIAATVRSFILWHISVIIYYKPEWLIFLVVYYLVFEFVLYSRQQKGQI